jgi:hypothetical protein
VQHVVPSSYAKNAHPKIPEGSNAAAASKIEKVLALSIMVDSDLPQ